MKPQLDLSRPTTRPAPTAAPTIPPVKEGSQRLAVDLPVSKYLAMKGRAQERGITLREYLLELLARDGI